MRCDQYIGLNDWAKNFVRGEKVLDHYEIVVIQHLDGTVELKEERRPVHRWTVKGVPSGNTFDGMFRENGVDPYPLLRYIFEDGRIFEEYLQVTIHSSGPMFFIALYDQDGKVVPESVWPTEELNKY
jgi:hypothetical protein